MRFKVDENLPGELAQLLGDHGHEAHTVLDQRLGGSPDPTISEVCKREGRVLITLDLGFADIRAYPPAEYSGLVILRLRRTDKRTVLAAARRLITFLEAETPMRRLWIVDQRRIRVRK